MLNLSRERVESREKGDFSIWPSQLGLELTRPAQLLSFYWNSQLIFFNIPHSEVLEMFPEFAWPLFHALGLTKI